MSHEISNIDRVGLRGNQAWHELGVFVKGGGHYPEAELVPRI